MNKFSLRLLLGLTLVLSLPSVAYAQVQYTVVASCGAETLPIGAKGAPYMDTTGKICSSAVGGSSTFAWPGTAGLATGGTATAGTMPYVNSYIVGGAASFTWPGTAGNATGGTTTAGTMPYVNAYVIGGSAASFTPFTTGGTYLNVPVVTSTSTNSALPAGTNVVINNNGAYKLIYKLSTSGATAVTSATADGTVQAGATQEIAVGANTNIAYATTGVGLTTQMQVIGGTGIWVGSNTITANLGQVGLATPATVGQIGGPDNGGLLQAPQVTAPGTSATNFALAVQGASAGIPFRTDQTTWGGTAITNVPTAVGVLGTGNTPTVNAYIVGGGGSGGTSATFGAAFPSLGTAAGAQYLTSPPTLTPGQMVALQTDVNGNLKVNVASSINPSIGVVGSVAPASAALVGFRAENAEPALASNGNLVAAAVGLEGKQINLPYANKENMLRGANSTTGTSPTTFTGMGAQGAGVFIYVTSVQCYNVSAPSFSTPLAPVLITLNDSASTPVIAPAGSGAVVSYPTPLRVAANTAFTFTPGVATPTITCSAQGYFGL